jgi:hypothetical protein
MSVNTHVSAPLLQDGFPLDWISGTSVSIYREIPDFQIWLKSDTLHESRNRLFIFLLATLNLIKALSSNGIARLFE